MKQPATNTFLYPCTVKGLCPLMTKLWWGKTETLRELWCFLKYRKECNIILKLKGIFGYQVYYLIHKSSPYLHNSGKLIPGPDLHDRL